MEQDRQTASLHTRQLSTHAEICGWMIPARGMGLGRQAHWAKRGWGLQRQEHGARA